MNQEEAAQSTIERLRRELAERDDMLAFVAHELRNPMHALSLQLASARALADATGADTKVIERIAKTQATLTRYINRATVLLDVAQQASRAYPVSTRKINLAVLLVKIVDNARADADHHGVALHLEAPDSCFVVSDPLALEHVVGNLLGNAFKHAHCTRVVLSLRAGKATADIVVADNGRGIAQADQQSIFNKFDRGTAKALGSGSGLGLWIARQLMQALHGSISLDSRPDKGCRFTLQLPLIQA